MLDLGCPKLAFAAAVAICFKLLPAGIDCSISLVMIVCFPVIVNFGCYVEVLCWLSGLPRETWLVLPPLEAMIDIGFICC